jgi:hypothetical protein
MDQTIKINMEPQVQTQDYPIMHNDILKTGDIKNNGYWVVWIWSAISVVIFCCLFITFTYLYKHVR